MSRGISATGTATGLVRIGVLALPLAGALKLIGNLGTFGTVGYGVPQPREATMVTSWSFMAGEFVGSVLPVVMILFGVVALYAYLAPSAPRRVLVAALVCSVLGAGLVLPAMGVIAYALPALGHAYQAGDTGAMDVADSFFTFPRSAMLYVGVLYPIGTILHAIAGWRSRTLSRTACVLLAVAGVLISTPAALHVPHLAGGAVLLLGGGWLARTVRRSLGASPAHGPTAGFHTADGALEHRTDQAVRSIT